VQHVLVALELEQELEFALVELGFGAAGERKPGEETNEDG
jgi:hypothetical protein